LIELGICWPAADAKKPDAAAGTQHLAGKTFVLTGTLSAPRDHFKQLITLAGGKVTGSVSARTDFVVAGENPGSKASKAQTLEVAILDEAGLIELLEGN
jgi:DNA ligase (NAD+)